MSTALSPQRIAEIRRVLDTAVTEMHACGHATATPAYISIDACYQPGEDPIFNKTAMRLPELVALLDGADDWTNGSAAKAAEIVALKARANAQAAEIAELRRSKSVYDDFRRGLEARIGQMITETFHDNSRLRTFITALLDEWDFGGDIDGGTFQDMLVKHGLLAPVTVHAPCCENCTCAESATEADWKEGVECFRKTPLIGGDAPASATAEAPTAVDRRTLGIIGTCEGCGTTIREGDDYHLWEDSVRTCAKCGGPTPDQIAAAEAEANPVGAEVAP